MLHSHNYEIVERHPIGADVFVVLRCSCGKRKLKLVQDVERRVTDA